ncbi:preprotein translocase subunit YajC [Streptomyces sp. IF17]|nr:preprotein translocase subunit YajC [Streptomyces alkaliphilus]
MPAPGPDRPPTRQATSHRPHEGITSAVELFLPLILLIGVMLLMSRSARNKQRQMMEMRDAMEPGTGVRTIGGMYALVKEVREDSVLLEVAPGVPALYTKTAIAAVLDADEYRRIVNDEPWPEEDGESPVVPDDASSLTGGAGTDRPADGEPDKPIGLDKPADATGETPDAEDAGETSRRDRRDGSAEDDGNGPRS